MPREIRREEDFGKALGAATEIRVIKRGEGAKIKLRTKDALYTFKTKSSEVDGLLKGTKVPVLEL